jgi:GTP-binding protein
MKPLVAIVGRPNVGKSTFFNKMVGSRVSIVDDQPGVTRDRVYGDCEWQRYTFTLIDTGGIDVANEDPLFQQMRRQAQIAIETADAILFFVDGREGETGADREVADLLRRARKPVLLVVNKIDARGLEGEATDFYSLGMGEPIAISSVNLLGVGDLLEELCKLLPDPDEAEEASDKIKVAVVGRPNVGKSSLVNRLLGEERVMVSDIAGTTRDAIDTDMRDEDGQMYTIIDTAGIRRKARIDEGTLERYSVIRALSAIRRCDIALMLIDSVDGVTEQDQRIAGYVQDEGKACIILVNKWDLPEKETGTLERYTREVRANLRFLTYAPLIFISAQTGQRTHRILPEVKRVMDNASRRITTGVLNDVLRDAMAINPPPTERGRRLRIYYTTQQTTRPPAFLLFTNDPELMYPPYERYLENHFRKAFDLEGTPIRFFLRARGEGQDG